MIRRFVEHGAWIVPVVVGLGLVMLAIVRMPSLQQLVQIASQ